MTPLGWLGRKTSTQTKMYRLIWGFTIYIWYECHFLSIHFYVFIFVIFSYDVILTAETIYKPDNYGKLTHIFSNHLSTAGKVYPLCATKLHNLLQFVYHIDANYLGPVVQSIISLRSSLMKNLLTVVALYFQIHMYIDIFAAKMWVAFAVQKLLTFFQQININVFPIFQDRNFNVTLANNFVKFWTAWPWTSNFITILILKFVRDHLITCIVIFFFSNNLLLLLFLHENILWALIRSASPRCF